MLFELKVRLSEVTDLKWPHGNEWQCGNTTLAMSWSNHVRILSFATMASRQGAVTHGFLSKIAGGCSSYDVIALWPHLTWSFFYQKLRKVCSIRIPQNPAKKRAAVFFAICQKPQGSCTNPPVRARVIYRVIFFTGQKVNSNCDTNKHVEHINKYVILITTLGHLR